MESKNLNDIVIDDNSDSKKAQLKNILTLLALLFIILVISIVITKIILGDDNETKGGVATSGVTAISQQSVDSSNASSVSGVGAMTAAAVGVAGGAIAAKAISSKREESADSRSPIREPEHIIKKPVVHREYREPERVVSKTHTTKKSISKKYYVKVGIFKDPSNAIKMIKEKGGLHYKTIKTGSGLTKVLVGPYATKDDAKDDLDKVKEITPDAFILKIN
jgi:cell division septation protein DedD